MTIHDHDEITNMLHPHGCGTKTMTNEEFLLKMDEILS